MTRDPAEDLRRIAFCLERALEPSYRVKAFRTAAGVVDREGREEVARRAAAGSLTDLTGIGKVTALVITESLAGEEPVYLRRVQTLGDEPVSEGAGRLRAALQGDLHTHSDWSDGGSPIEEMARAARDLGHAYVVLTDHSPRLTVANGLSPARLRQQLDVVAALNLVFEQEHLDGLAEPFRLLTGIECDINEDGSLDQDPDLLARLDVVVACVHSKLRMERDAMTARMVAAISNPATNVLGHCTGRQVLGHGRGGKGRPESEFDAEVVFAACAQFDVAVEVNSRPERLDPPKRLLRLAVEAGCRVAIDTDAHAPGQLDWQHLGCERAHLCGVEADSVVNTWDLDRLLDWSGAATRAGRRWSGMSAATGSISRRATSSGTASDTSSAHAASRHRASTRWSSRSDDGAVRQVGQGRDRPSAPLRRTSAQVRRRLVRTAAAKAASRASRRSPSSTKERSTSRSNRAWPAASWQRLDSSGSAPSSALTWSPRGPRSGSSSARSAGKTLRQGRRSASCSPRARTGRA